jgi:hypothetical protein
VRGGQGDLPASLGHPDSRPRLLLSYDQILDRKPFWALSSNLFAWIPRSGADDVDRAAKFTAELEASDPDQPWDLVRDTFLGEP